MKQAILSLAFSAIYFTAFSQGNDSIPNQQLAECWVSNLPTDRPGQSYNAQTLFKNQWQLQAGVNWGKFYNFNRGKDFDITSLPVDIRYGITNKLEIMLSPSFGFATVPGGGGIEYTLSSYGASLRYSIFENKPFGNLGAMANYEYSTYESGLETLNTYRIRLMYSVPLGQIITFTTNVGLATVSSGPDYIPYTVNFSFAVSPKFGFYAEAYGDLVLSELDGVENPFFFDLGLYFLKSASFQFDAGYNRGGTSEYTDDYAFVGISYRFGCYKKSSL